MEKKLNDRARIIINKFNQIRLKNNTFSIIASNCNGACITHDLGQEFRSPFVNLWMYPNDFIKFLQSPKEYLKSDLIFFDAEKPYPVAKINDITLFFQHYQTAEEASSSWHKRLVRINWDNVFIMMTDRDGCTYEMLEAFDRLPYQNKVVFTHLPYENIASAFYIPGFESQPCVGVLSEYTNRIIGQKGYDAFDYVKWLNGNRT